MSGIYKKVNDELVELQYIVNNNSLDVDVFNIFRNALNSIQEIKGNPIKYFFLSRRLYHYERNTLMDSALTCTNEVIEDLKELY